MSFTNILPENSQLYMHWWKATFVWSVWFCIFENITFKLSNVITLVRNHIHIKWFSLFMCLQCKHSHADTHWRKVIYICSVWSIILKRSTLKVCMQKEENNCIFMKHMVLYFKTIQNSDDTYTPTLMRKHLWSELWPAQPMEK